MVSRSEAAWVNTEAESTPDEIQATAMLRPGCLLDDQYPPKESVNHLFTGCGRA